MKLGLAARLLVVFVLLGACAPRASAPITTPTAAPAAEASADTRRMRSPGDSPEGDAERIFRLAATVGAPQRGKDEAKVTIEVCSDFECPFCARLVPTLHELEQNYGEFVRVLWRNCPLPFHEHALPAAEAASEVLAQGGAAAFWAYHDILFAHQDALDAESLAKLAEQIPGVNGAEVSKALADHRHIPRIKNELMALVDSGATSQGFGTPATFVNGRMMSGAQPYEKFEDAVERALAETPEQRKVAETASDEAYPMARARHILVQWKGAEGADPSVTRSKEDALKRAQEAHAKVVAAGSSFDALAHEYSNCPSAAQGGELGRVTRGELVPEFESVLFTLLPGQVSGVVESPFGFHVIQRED